MQQELIKNLEVIFDKQEKWNSFIDLVKLRDALQKKWVKSLRQLILEAFSETEHWQIEHGGAWDCRWKLRGRSKAPHFWLCDQGNFHFVIPNQGGNDAVVIKTIFESEKYAAIKYVWGKDVEFNVNHEIKIRQRGKWSFNSIYDGAFEFDRLVWFAGNETELFLSQIKAKVDCFTNSSVTNLLLELHNDIKAALTKDVTPLSESQLS